MFEFDLFEKENLTVRVQIKLYFEKKNFRITFGSDLISNKILKTKTSCVGESIYSVIHKSCTKTDRGLMFYTKNLSHPIKTRF